MNPKKENSENGQPWKGTIPTMKNESESCEKGQLWKGNIWKKTKLEKYESGKEQFWKRRSKIQQKAKEESDESDEGDNSEKEILEKGQF